MICQYRTEVIPLAPGPGGATDEVLNRFASEGWRVASTELVPVSSLQARMQGQGPGLGLFVLLERCEVLETAPLPPDAPALAEIHDAA